MEFEFRRTAQRSGNLETRYVIVCIRVLAPLIPMLPRRKCGGLQALAPTRKAPGPRHDPAFQPRQTFPTPRRTAPNADRSSTARTKDRSRPDRRRSQLPGSGTKIDSSRKTTTQQRGDGFCQTQS
jgi:hypothetical protein